jgi:hypothetical protein
MDEAGVAWAKARVLAVSAANRAAAASGSYVSIHMGGSPAAQAWADANPDAESAYCCMGDADQGPAGCTCWRPEYEVDQADPVPPTGPDDLVVPATKCADCAYRPGSPERADEYMADELISYAYAGRPFFCHTGCRRPLRWRHPDGRVIDGDPSDYRPLIRDAIPYQADGRPAPICAGWAAIAAQAAQTSTTKSIT